MNIKSALRTPTLILLAGVAVLIAAPEAVPADTPRVSVSDARIVRPVDGVPGPTGVIGLDEMRFTITRTGDTSYPIAVEYETVDGTAEEGPDYRSTRNVLTIPAGATSAPVAVDVYSKDREAEKANFFLRLTRASGPLALELLESREEVAVPYPSPPSDTIQASAQADVNGDGLPDRVILTRREPAGPSDVSIMLNTTPGGGDPSFEAAGQFPTGLHASDIAAADFDGDGKSDLAIVETASNTVSVFVSLTAAGATAATFAPSVAFDAGKVPTSVDSADFNQDGKQDLVMVNAATTTVGVNCPGCGDPFGGSVAILLNTTPAGAVVPSFTAPTNIPAAGAIVLVTDIDQDGAPDLLLNHTFNRARSSAMSILLNTTAFQAELPEFEMSKQHFDTFGTSSFAVADMNGDNRLDLLTGQGGLLIHHACKCSVLAFEFPVRAYDSEEIILIDLDGDGTRELAPLGDAGRVIMGVYGQFTDLNGDGRSEFTRGRYTADNYSLLVGTPPLLPVTLARATATGTILPNDGTVPDAFNFRDKRGVSTSKNTLSNTVTVAGLSADKSATLTLTRRSGVNTAFSINGGAYAKGTATVRNGDRVRLRNRVADGKTTAIVTVEIGGMVDEWKISTGP